MANFVLAGLEDGHVVVDDGVLGARRFQLQQDPGLFAARELALVDPKIIQALAGATPNKIIIVPKRLINFVL